MPKAKKDLKQKLILQIKECVSKYTNMFILSYTNFSSLHFKQLMEQWKDSKFFISKNKVIQVALGREAENEIAKNISYLTPKIQGLCIVLFTNRSLEDVNAMVEKFCNAAYGKGGQVPNETIILKKGPLESLSYSVESYLRTLSVPVRNNQQKLELTEDYTVAEKGKEMTVEQAKVQRLLGMKLNYFKLAITGHWKNDGEFKLFNME
jgi:mRNA turnover protein 4